MVDTADTSTNQSASETRSTTRGETSGTGAHKRHSTSAGTEQLVITRSADNGEILGIEKVDANGSRSELSEEEYGRIAGEDEIDEIGAALDTAFEAGVREVLGMDDVQQEDGGEESILERLILLRLLAGRIGRIQNLRQSMLRRLVLRRLVRRRMLRNRKERISA